MLPLQGKSMNHKYVIVNKYSRQQKPCIKSVRNKNRVSRTKTFKC